MPFPTSTTNIDELAQTIWDYHQMHQPLQKSDAILVLGSHDLRVAEYAAKLYHDGWAPLVIMSGGLGHLTAGLWKRPEAEVFAEVAQRHGVPREKMLLETTSTNTGENITNTRSLLDERNLDLKRILVVQKPYMERRAYATVKKFWPEVDVMVTSPPISFANYPTSEIPKDEVIAIIVGDLQRIKLYGPKGFQIPQQIPANVWSAYEQLVRLGYTQHLIA